jgi:hypothetical protein
MDPVYKRFGVRSFHHEELVHQAQSETRESIFVEILQKWFAAKRDEGLVELELTSTDLMTELTAAMGGPANMSTFKVENIGWSLKKCMDQKMVPELVGRRIKRGVKFYRFVFTGQTSPVEEPF